MNWRYVTSNGYDEDFEPVRLSLRKYSIGEVPVSSILPEVPNSLKDALLTYSAPGEAEVRLLLKPGCLSLLETNERHFLAQLDQKIFVKTHELPPSSPIEGELAVQMIRHPGAALASYFALERHFGASSGEFPLLMNIIKGHCNFGAWSDYHSAWGETKMPVHRVSYEDAHTKELDVAASIGSFLGFSQPPTKADFFSSRHAVAPLRYPSGSIDAWIDNFPRDEMKMLRATHKEIARKFGYFIPFHKDEDIVLEIKLPI
jgi:hypothetical protein